MLLHRTDELDPKTPILELPAESKRGPNFELQGTRQPVTACDNWSIIAKIKRLLYIPCHTECVFLAKKVIAFRGEATLLDLWLVLKTRFQSSSRFIGFLANGPICNVRPPNGWPGVCNLQWELWTGMIENGDDDDDLAGLARYDPLRNAINLQSSKSFEADPHSIPNLTNSILRHLQYVLQPMLPLSERFPKYGLAKCLPQLPPEIILVIMRHLRPFCILPKTATS